MALTNKFNYELLSKVNELGILQTNVRNNIKTGLLNFKNKTVHDVVSFLSPHQISVEISHTLPQNTAHHCAQCTVTDQRPLAGTFIRLQEKKDIVHIKVAPA